MTEPLRQALVPARAAGVAMFAVFALNGMILGSVAARVPALAGQAHTDPGGIGVMLLCGSLGLIPSAAFGSRICVRLGARGTVFVCAIASCLVLPVLGLATSVPALCAVYFVLGSLSGIFDVSMNVAAVAVVHATERPLMPMFHAAYSIGGLAGSVIGGVAAQLGWPPLQHFGLVAVLGIAAVLAVGRAVPGARPTTARPDQGAGGSLLRRPVLWVLGGIMLCAAIAEGATADWSALFLVNERGLDQASAATGYAAFSIAMALNRLVGVWWQERLGPYRVLTGGALVAGAGLLTAVLVPVGAVAYVGFALAGIGLAFAFPVTIGLAGSTGGAGGEREIGFVTAIAYSGYMAGPPLIGALAQHTNLSVALGAVAVVAMLIAPGALAVRRSMP